MFNDKKFYKGRVFARGGKGGWLYYRYVISPATEASPERFKDISLKTKDPNVAAGKAAGYDSERYQFGTIREFKFPHFDKVYAPYKNNYAKTQADNSLIQLECAVNKFRKMVKPGIMNEITPLQARTFQAELLATVQESTANNYVKYLRPFFSQAKRDGFIEKDPFEDIKDMRVGKKVPVWFTHKEREATLARVRQTEDPAFALMLLLSQDTGMRIMESLHQRMEDVDLVSGFLKVGIHHNGITGPLCECYACVRDVERKTKRGSARRGWAPKNRLERFIPLTPALCKALAERQKIAPTGCLVEAPERTVQKVFARVYKGLGLPSRKVVHIWRHSLSTEMDQAGVRRTIARAILGHSGQDVTDLYTHYFKPEMKQEFQKVLTAREVWASSLGVPKFQVV